jgi:hypothetical protein
MTREGPRDCLIDHKKNFPFIFFFFQKMSSSQQRQMWYSLVQADGAAFKNSTVDKVSVQSTGDIADLRDAVQLKNAANKLAKVDASDLKVFKIYKGQDDSENEPLDEETPVSGLGEAGQKKKDALLVLVPESRVSSRSSSDSSLTTAQPQPVLKAHRQQRYKEMSVEASCRKYLDAIAKELALYYVFDFKHTGPTIGDVLKAKDGVEGVRTGPDDDTVYWSFRRAERTYQYEDDEGYTCTMRRGQPLKTETLPGLYSPDEWDRISKFNKTTTKRVHNARLPQLSNGKPYIIIPHSEFTPDMVAFLKNIGVKATLFSSPDDLVVKDEDALSVGSSVA